MPRHLVHDVVSGHLDDVHTLGRRRGGFDQLLGSGMGWMDGSKARKQGNGTNEGGRSQGRLSRVLYATGPTRAKTRCAGIFPFHTLRVPAMPESLRATSYAQGPTQPRVQL